MSYKIWCVDDNRVIAESVMVVLTLDGFEAITVPGPKVLARLEHETPDAMILDLHMPGAGSSGNDILRAIQANPLWTFSIIVMTGFEDDLDRSVRGRVYRIIKKTTDPQEILDTLWRAVGQRA